MTSQSSPATETDVSLTLSPRFSPSSVSAVPPSSGPDNGSTCQQHTTINYTAIVQTRRKRADNFIQNTAENFNYLTKVKFLILAQFSVTELR